ncbi:RNFT1 isoform 8, partial [Pan troglodytes]
AANNFYVCKQKHCKSGFSKRKVLKDSVCLVTGILSRIFCSFILHLSFSVTLLQARKVSTMTNREDFFLIL